MKIRYGIAVTGILAVVLMAGMPLRADENMSSMKDKPKPGMCKNECPIDERQEHFKKMLGLTDDQSKKFDTIKQAEKAEMDPLRDKIQTLTKKMDWQIAAKASDDDIKSTLDEARKTRESMESSMKRFRTQMEDILTPTQQAKFMIFKSKMMEHHDWKHGEWGHHDDLKHHGEGWEHEEGKGGDHEEQEN